MNQSSNIISSELYINILPLKSTQVMEKYSQYHSKTQQKINDNNETKVAKVVELEVNISIGKNKFLLQVQKCSNLHEQVLEFLKLHHINLKYEGPILAMVREELSKKQIFKDPPNNQIQQLKKVKTQMEYKRKLVTEKSETSQSRNHQHKHKQDNKQQTRQNKQNYSSEYNSNSKHGMSTGQSEAQSNVRELTPKQNPKSSAEATKCQNVYERWKVKEKIKENERLKNANPTEKQTKNKTAHFKSTANQKQQQKLKEKSVSQKKLESHSPDYFYNKGIKFRQAKQVHMEEIYKQKYPFQMRKEATITPTKKNQLHERLYKQFEMREKGKIEKRVENLLVEKDEEEKKPVMDKYKKKVIQRDREIDKALGYLINNKMIENPYKIENVSKSPFRKINLCKP